MNSTSIIKKDLLESQNFKLKEQCSELKQRFSLVRRKLSHQIPPLNLNPDLTNLNQRLAIYKTEYTQLSKTFLRRQSQSSALTTLQKTIEEQEGQLKSLQKENLKLTNSINSNSKSKNTQQDPAQEVSLLKSLISKHEHSAIETRKLIEAKDLKFSELREKFLHFESLAGSQGLSFLTNSKQLSKKEKGRPHFETIEKAEDYYKSLQRSYTNCISRLVKVINDLESALFELKDQETILHSTYIKKKQQHRLILTMGESDAQEPLADDRQVLDVKFYYKPTIRYLYI